jgi:hypothetical protein
MTDAFGYRLTLTSTMITVWYLTTTLITIFVSLLIIGRAPEYGDKGSSCFRH